MNLHEDKDVFIELVQKTCETLGIQDIFIEKDYWVTYVLKTLSEWDTEKSVVFKGGTSLSKGYKIIDRFSEDVDLVLRDTNLSPSQIKKKLKDVHKLSIRPPLEERDTNRTSKGSRFRKVDYTYPQILDEYGGFGEVSNNLLVELNSFGNPFPTVDMEIKSYITEMLEGERLSQLISRFKLEAVSVPVLDYRQTLCEKIMSLLRITLKENYEAELNSKVRHFYDISKLLQEDEISKYVESEDFINGLKKVYENDTATPEFESDWSTTKLSEVPFIQGFDEILSVIEPRFKSQFQTMLYTREKFQFADIKKHFNPVIELMMRTDFKSKN